jgi:hypothetical protein
MKLTSYFWLKLQMSTKSVLSRGLFIPSDTTKRVLQKLRVTITTKSPAIMGWRKLKRKQKRKTHRIFIVATTDSAVVTAQSLQSLHAQFTRAERAWERPIQANYGRG